LGGKAQYVKNAKECEALNDTNNINKLIKELKSLLEYAKGTSLKKEIPLIAHTEEEMGYFICPACDMAVSYLNDKEEHKYCLNCGQKIKWD
jgi:NADH pyrophosphatase NudC (nudix superfamily)